MLNTDKDALKDISSVEQLFKKGEYVAVINNVVFLLMKKNNSILAVIENNKQQFVCIIILAAWGVFDKNYIRCVSDNEVQNLFPKTVPVEGWYEFITDKNPLDMTFEQWSGVKQIKSIVRDIKKQQHDILVKDTANAVFKNIAKIIRDSKNVFETEVDSNKQIITIDTDDDRIFFTFDFKSHTLEYSTLKKPNDKFIFNNQIGNYYDYVQELIKCKRTPLANQR